MDIRHLTALQPKTRTAHSDASTPLRLVPTCTHPATEPQPQNMRPAKAMLLRDCAYPTEALRHLVMFCLRGPQEVSKVSRSKGSGGEATLTPYEDGKRSYLLRDSITMCRVHQHSVILIESLLFAVLLVTTRGHCPNSLPFVHYLQSSD